jgi:hypothetical protein
VVWSVVRLMGLDVCPMRVLVGPRYRGGRGNNVMWTPYIQVYQKSSARVKLRRGLAGWSIEDAVSH